MSTVTIRTPPIGERARRLARTVTLPRIAEWLAAAQPGARLLYAVGERAPGDGFELVAAYLLDAKMRGFVELSQVEARSDPGFRHDFFVARIEGGVSLRNFQKEWSRSIENERERIRAEGGRA